VKLHSLGPGFAAWLVVAALVMSCSPAVPEPPEAKSALESESFAAAAQPEVVAPKPRPKQRAERRPAAQAPEQYRYIDERGRVQVAARLEQIPERQRSTASRIETPAARAPSYAQADEYAGFNSADVVIFTTPSCPYCRAAIAYFEKKGISYVNRDVSSDEEARAEYLELTGGRPGVPVIQVGDAWIQGWSQPEFDRLLVAAR